MEGVRAMIAFNLGLCSSWCTPSVGDVTSQSKTDHVGALHARTEVNVKHMPQESKTAYTGTTSAISDSSTPQQCQSPRQLRQRPSGLESH